METRQLQPLDKETPPGDILESVGSEALLPAELNRLSLAELFGARALKFEKANRAVEKLLQETLMKEDLPEELQHELRQEHKDLSKEQTLPTRIGAQLADAATRQPGIAAVVQARQDQDNDSGAAPDETHIAAASHSDDDGHVSPADDLGQPNHGQVVRKSMILGFGLAVMLLVFGAAMIWLL